MLSVVVPAHRAERYLPYCLDSVLSEAAPELEVVIVDDHSPDGTGEVAEAYARRDPRVRVVHLAAHAGPGRARNQGIAHARGAYLWFVDADDWLAPGSVPAVLARLAVTHPDVLVVDHAEVFPGGRVVPGTPPGTLAAGAPAADAPTAGTPAAGTPACGPLADRPELLWLAHSACTKVVRRDFLDRIGLRFHPGWYEDSSFNHPLLLAAHRIDILDRVCYYYRQRPGGSITKSVSVRHFDVFAQYRWMWAAAQRTGEAYERFRPELFRLMIDHLLVIAGNPHRVPPRQRREFFRRLVREYRHRQPPGGYPVPGGAAGLKHRLVRWHAYEAYAALRLARHAAARLSRRARRAGLSPAAWPPGRRSSGTAARTVPDRPGPDARRTAPAPGRRAAAAAAAARSDSTSG